MSPRTASKPTDEEALDLNGSGDGDEDEVLNLGELTRTRRLVSWPVDDKDADGGVRTERRHMRTLDDFGIEDQQYLLSLSRRYQQLMQRERKLTKGERERLRDCFDEMFNMVLDAPADLKRKMPDRYRVKVVNAFTAGPLFAQQEAQMAVIRRLIDNGKLEEEDVNEVLQDIRLEVARDQMRSQQPTSTTGS